MRKEVARALRRLSAVGEMAELAKRENDPVVRRLLTTPECKAFGQRLSAFMGGAKQPARRSGRRETAQLFVVEPLAGRPPRPAEYFRQLLERIRKLVRGNGAKDGGAKTA